MKNTRLMTRTLMLTGAALSGLLATQANAFQVASFDGTGAPYTSGNQGFWPRPNDATSTTHTNAYAWSTDTAAMAPSANYSGPSIFGGYYAASENSEAVAQNFNQGLVFRNTAFGNTIRLQGIILSGGTATHVSSVQRFGVMFETSAPSSLGAADSLTIVGRETGTGYTSEYRWLVATGSSVYVSQATFDLKVDSANDSSAFDTPASLINPAAVLWAEWTPGADMSLGALDYSISGASIAGITRVGYYADLAGSGTNNRTPTVDVLVYSADLTAVPEPSAYAALAGVLALAWVAYRRRRA